MRDFVRRLFRVRPRDPAAAKAEFRAEIEAHLALATEHLVRRGVPLGDAQTLARQRFGDFDEAMRGLIESATTREVAVLRREWWDGVMQDGRITLRQLRRSPGITLGIASILALGIGVNLVMFDVVDRLLLSPPPGVARPEGVRRLIPPHFNFFDRSINNYALTNYATYLDLRSVHGFALAAYGMPEDASLGRGREASRVVVNGASASFFTVLGVTPYLGRFYSASRGLAALRDSGGRSQSRVLETGPRR